MKNLILGLALLLLTNASWAVTSQSPIPPAIQKKLSEVNKKKNLLAKMHIGSTYASGSEVLLGSYVPPKSLITRAFVFVKEVVVSASNNSIAFGCEATNDLVASAAYATSSLAVLNALQEGVPTGTTATSVYSSDGCQLEANVTSGGSGVTDGELYLFLEYVPVN